MILIETNLRGTVFAAVDTSGACSSVGFDRSEAAEPCPADPTLPRVAMPQVAMIAISGVDGSGKTRMAGLMLDRLALAGIPHRQVWSRFRNYLSKPLLAVARITGHSRKEVVGKVRTGYHDFSRSPLLAWGFLGLHSLDLVLDILIRFRLRRRGTIVADRCAIDSLVDLAVDTGLDEVVLDRLGPRILRLLPQPLLAVVVERPPALIAEQRPDALADRHFARRRALYARLAKRLGLPVVRNDTSLDAAVGELSRLLAAGGAIR